MPKIFLLGATGYIGGDTLYALHEAHPDWEYCCLVRDSDKGALVAATYPKVRLVYGDLSSEDVIQKAAGEADVVLNLANADSAPGAHNSCIGLQSHFPRSGFYIHTSGTGILMYPDTTTSTYGAPSSKTWDDITSVTEITDSIPDSAAHRDVDKIVLEYSKGTVKTAIVCPPCIYGQGRGPGNKTSIQLPTLARRFLERKKGFQVGEGQARWSNVHVADLSDLYVLLAEEALAENGGKASWGATGYYFAENGEHAWGDISHSLAKYMYKQSLLPSADIDTFSAADVEELYPGLRAMWGANSRSRASRAREELGWKPSRPGVEATFKELVDEEVLVAKRDGVVKGHAAEAAGE